ncbi:uncharacterized protein A4U43_C04F32080 [Asparagus officinalis]|uniref:Uncharacterized protein n=1 Tax=Asparagus officinalis TaxID=4686 RepID=A0A5P1F7W5_ASPOF|nr:uncharacterized protein A4U43_C04F32080 [Asparagus officinalis]
MGWQLAVRVVTNLGAGHEEGERLGREKGEAVVKTADGGGERGRWGSSRAGVVVVDQGWRSPMGLRGGGAGGREEKRRGRALKWPAAGLAQTQVYRFWLAVAYKRRRLGCDVLGWRSFEQDLKKSKGKGRRKDLKALGRNFEEFLNAKRWLEVVKKSLSPDL